MIDFQKTDTKIVTGSLRVLMGFKSVRSELVFVILLIAGLGLLKLDDLYAKGSSASQVSCGNSIKSLKNARFSDSYKPLGAGVYVIDTNVLYTDPEVISKLDRKGVVFIIPRPVIGELDRHKSLHDERAPIAREISRNLRRLIDGAKEGVQVKLPKGGTLIFTDASDSASWPASFDKAKVDDRIVVLAKQIQDRNVEKKVFVLSGDNNVLISAKSIGLRYLSLKPEVDKKAAEELMSGPVVVDLAPSIESEYTQFNGRYLSLEDAGRMGLSRDVELYPNQFVIFGKTDELENLSIENAAARIRRYIETKDGPVLAALHIKEIAELAIQPRNIEQLMALDLLVDPKVKLVTLGGRAGTGKTLLTLAAGIAETAVFKEHPLYKDGIILTRPIAITGDDIGFLPGDVEAKMAPLVAAFRDNLSVIVEEFRKRDFRTNPKHLNNGVKKSHNSGNGKSVTSEDFADENVAVKEVVDKLMKSPLVSIQTITYARGRTLPNVMLIIDEAQNLTLHELRTIVTRAGEGTKVVLLGDVDQIDKKFLGPLNNGLIIAATRARGYNRAGHVTLTNGERSELATWASEAFQP